MGQKMNVFCYYFFGSIINVGVVFHPSFFVYNKKALRSSPKRNGGNQNKKPELLYHTILRFKRGTNRIHDYRIQTIKDIPFIFDDT